MSVTTMIEVAVLSVVVILLVWLSLRMASNEFAVTRVTRSSLNNRILQVQTDSEMGKLAQHKKIDRIHRVQRLVADRSGTASSCAFFRICCNVMSGVIVAVIASLLDAPVWATLIVGLVFTVLVALISVLVRRHSPGLLRPVDTMLASARLLTVCTALTPFAREIGKEGRERHGAELSADEQLERLQREQSRMMVEQLVETGDFDPEVGEMLGNVLTLSETLTREIMVPRTDMICAGQDETLGGFLQLCSRSGYSRIPVIGEDIDDLKGVAYLKDAVRAVAFNASATERPVSSIVRDPTLVPESKPVDDLFHEMQRTRQHVAVVADEYGGIAGMVTIEDAIEQIVGELEDEHDHTQRQNPEQVGARTWRMPARAPITDLESIFEVSIDEDDVDTVYGLLTKLLGRVPIVGMSACTHGLKLTAVDSAGRRKKVSTIVVEPEHQSAEPPDSGEEPEHDSGMHED